MHSKATSEFTAGIGERIRAVRVAKNMDQIAMSEKLNVSRQSISGYETERLMPSTKMLEAIAVEFKVNPWWLLYGVGDRDLTYSSVQSDATRNVVTDQTLSPQQRTLIEYIKIDRENAANIANQLFDRATKISDDK
jgi:transcriptional regulator with XRE-family HTH domain